MSRSFCGVGVTGPELFEVGPIIIIGLNFNTRVLWFRVVMVCFWVVCSDLEGYRRVFAVTWRVTGNRLQ